MFLWRCSFGLWIQNAKLVVLSICLFRHGPRRRHKTVHHWHDYHIGHGRTESQSAVLTAHSWNGPGIEYHWTVSWVLQYPCPTLSSSFALGT